MIAVVTSGGQVYSWDSKSSRKAKQDMEIEPKVVDGLRNISTVVVGEKHCLVLQKWRTGDADGSSVKTASLQSHLSSRSSSSSDSTYTSSGEGSSDPAEWRIHETEFSPLVKSKRSKETKQGSKLMSLQVLCEIAVAKDILNPRTA